MTSKVPVVHEFMTEKVITLKSSMTISEAIDLLLKNRISGAPVVDEEGILVGVLSEKDCLRLFASGAYNQVPGAHVDHYMSKDLLTVGPNDGLFTVAGIFLKNTFRRLPVVEGGKLIGLVSRRDILDGSRKIWESSPVEKPWTDSRYLTDEIKAALK